MDGIILTTPVGAGGSGGNSAPVEDTIAATTTEVVDTVTAADCPAAKWLVTIHDTTGGEVQTVEINAMHDFAGVVCYSTAYRLGDDFDVRVAAVAGGLPDEIDLEIENNLANSVDICAFRIIQ